MDFPHRHRQYKTSYKTLKIKREPHHSQVAQTLDPSPRPIRSRDITDTNMMNGLTSSTRSSGVDLDIASNADSEQVAPGQPFLS